MPFTFSHPAIVLPFRYLPKRWISMTGLIVGSMVPDFEYFIRMRVKSFYSHTLPGLFWFDLPLGVLLVFIYNRLIKDNLIDNLPMSLRQRFVSFKGVHQFGHLRYFIVIVLSVFIGAVSHLFWDGFTHSNGYFVQIIPALSNTMQIGGHHFFVFKIIQHASTLTGTIVIVVAAYNLPFRV